VLSLPQPLGTHPSPTPTPHPPALTTSLSLTLTHAQEHGKEQRREKRRRKDEEEEEEAEEEEDGAHLLLHDIASELHHATTLLELEEESPKLHLLPPSSHEGPQGQYLYNASLNRKCYR